MWFFCLGWSGQKNPLIWLAKQRERILRLHPAIFIYPMFSKNFIKEMYKIRPARAAFSERLRKYRANGGIFKGKWCTRRRAFDRGSYQELNCHISGFHSWRPTSYEINTLCDALSKNFVWKNNSTKKKQFYRKIGNVLQYVCVSRVNIKIHVLAVVMSLKKVQLA